MSATDSRAGLVLTIAGKSAITVHLPSPKALVRHALPTLVESTLAPAALFYVVLMGLGFRNALIAALAWSWAAVARRVITRSRISGMLLVGTAMLTVRTAVSWVTGSAFVYFLQPTVGTFLVAAAFLISVPAGQPLAERMARDFCPLDPELLARPCVRQFFLRVSLLWTAAFLANATANLLFLLTVSVGTFVVIKTLISAAVIGLAVAVSTLWFRRALRTDGIHVRWGGLAQLPPRSTIPVPVAVPVDGVPVGAGAPLHSTGSQIRRACGHSPDGSPPTP